MNAVLDTAFEVFMSGTERPTAAEIAARAGVSTSSLFRYFTGIDDLRAQLVARYLEQHRDMLEPETPTDAGYEERSRRFVDHRIRVATVLDPISRRLQGRALDEPALLPIQAHVRSLIANQVPTHFGPELADLTPARRDDLTSVLDSMTSIEAFRILREQHDRSEAQIRRSWRAAITALLPPAAPSTDDRRQQEATSPQPAPSTVIRGRDG